MRKKIIATVVLWTLAGLCMAEELVIAVARLPLALPFYVAEDQGYFRAQSLTLRIEDCTVGRVCLKRLLDGEVSIATAADTPIVLSSFSSQAFFILATLSSSSNDTKLVARRSAGIAVPRDLAGKRIGTIAGTSAQYFLDAFLLFNGVDRRDVTVVNVTPAGASDAIQKNEVDALAIFEPIAYTAAAALGADGKILPSARINHTTFNLLIDRRIAGVRDAELEKMLSALAQAADFIRQRPFQAQAVLRKHLQLDQNFVDWIWKDYEYRISLDQSLIAVLESQARWAAREGYATGAAAPNYLKYIYPAPLARVLPVAITVVR